MPETVEPIQEVKYQMIIGGVVLMEGERVATIAGSAVVYTELEYKHVQGIWQTLLSDAALKAAAGAYSQAVAEALKKLGDAYGLEKGYLTKEDIALMERL